ncbi:MAG: tape measure protein, partial [Pseudohongiellaceae bacterium]
MDLATIQIKVDTRQVKAANEDIKQLGTTGQMTSKKVNAANDDMAKSAKSTTSAFKLLGGAMAALGVGALVSNFARTVTESERLKGSLKTMTGSTEDAAFAFSELERFAAQTPFTLDQSVEGFIKLKALGLDPSERALRSYGNTSAAMGKDMMQMVEAVADAATGEFERLKEFGIKASKQGDDVSLTFQGITTTIGNSSAEIQEYLLQIGETQFGSAMEDQMAALPGLLSNLSDNVSALFRKIGDVGGINLFATAISGASALIVGITNNLDILTTGVGAALAGFVAFTIGSNATRILGGFKAMQVSVLALNTAIRANPIGFIAAAIATAAVAIIANWDSIKVAAEKAGINIQIAFNKLNIFLLEAVGGALSKLSGMFTYMQNVAVATMTAVAAAVKNPTDAFNTFNETFDTTLAGLESGKTKTNIYADSIENSKNRVDELNEQLAGMNTEVATAETGFDNAGRSLSDYAIEVDANAVAASEL